jgi:Cu2+-containing amine oxidase
MSRGRFAACLLGVAAAIVFILQGSLESGAAPQIRPIKQPGGKPALATQEIVQEFPVAGPMQTAWKIHYVANNPGPGLMIAGAWFKTTPQDEWLKVIGNIRLSEIFVPYNNGTRIFDIGAQGNYSLLQHTAADTGVNGKLLNGGLVVQELRDTGIMWKYYKQVRRGQELVLWSTLGASNYNYIMEYGFRGDGTVTCRLGSTGRNFGNHETIGHMHHGCWRIDVDVDDPNHNSVYVVKRVETKGVKGARDVIEPFNNGVEGGVAWNAHEFTRIRVQSTKKNPQGKPMSYELIPHRHGTQRHMAPGDEFTHFDFWVTPYQWSEQYYLNLPRWVAQKRKITDTNVVLWYLSPAYHLPRDEDGVFINPQTGRAQVRGVAMTTWCGFELRPRNVFEKSPLYP